MALPGVDVSALTDDAGAVDSGAVERHIAALRSASERDRAGFAPPDTPPDEDRARRYLREGVGPAIGTYVLLRTGDRHYRFSPEEFADIERAMNTWLALYAACYGVETDPDASLRTAAELLLDTEDVGAVAATLTGVPRRER